MRPIYQPRRKSTWRDNSGNQEEMKYLLDTRDGVKTLTWPSGCAHDGQINLLQEPIVWYVEETVKGVTVHGRRYTSRALVAGLTNGGTAKMRPAP